MACLQSCSKTYWKNWATLSMKMTFMFHRYLTVKLFVAFQKFWAWPELNFCIKNVTFLSDMTEKQIVWHLRFPDFDAIQIGGIIIQNCLTLSTCYIISTHTDKTRYSRIHSVVRLTLGMGWWQGLSSLRRDGIGGGGEHLPHADLCTENAHKRCQNARIAAPDVYFIWVLRFSHGK